MRKSRFPLFTGRSMSLADYRAADESAKSERSVQRELIAELRNPLSTTGPTLAFHVPNGWHIPGVDAETSARAWRSLERDGALPGASDLIIGHGGCTLFLEIKRATGGTVSGPQLAFAEAAVAAGLDYRVAHGLSEARAILQKAGVLK